MNNEYGKLIWAKFYGPSTNYPINKSDAIFFLLVSPIALILIGLLLFYSPRQPSQRTLALFIIAIGILFPIIGMIGRMIKWHTNTASKLTREGVFDWDLFENGILVKHASETAIENTECHFIRFADISKAYVHVKPHQYKMIIKKINESDMINQIWDGERQVLDKYWKSTIKGSIWLFDHDGNLFDDYIDKSELREPKGFESILRQNVKDVE